MRRILAFTSTRSDYDLMSYVFKLLARDKMIDFRVLVSGAHLSATHGMTVQYIENDRIKILDKIETLFDSDSDAARIKSAAVLLQGAIQSVERFSPDLICYAGDREEVVVGALVGGYLKIPTAHFFAGDHDQDGLIDNPVRHATSRLSTFKFVSIDEHKDRLLCLGENPGRIFTIGSPALDKFKHEPPMGRSALCRALGVPAARFKRYALVIFHPLMDFEKVSVSYFRNILEVLDEREIPAVVNLPNIDPGSRGLMQVMQEYKGRDSLVFTNNLSRNLFVNVYRHAWFQVGNSSSGILEAASIPLPVVNVGERMIGRRSQKNVVFTAGSRGEIDKAVSLATSRGFHASNVKGIRNIYGDGGASVRAYRLLKSMPLASFAEFRKEDPLDICRIIKRSSHE